MIRTILKAQTATIEFWDFESIEQLEEMFPDWTVTDGNGFEWSIEII